LTVPPDIPPEIAEQLLNTRMGIEITEALPERVVGTMPVKGNLQPYGLLHGGANAVLAESLGSLCAVLNVGWDRAVVGLELSCTHHRAATKGLVTGVSTPLHVGRSTAALDIVITDEDGRRTCTARLTCLVLDRPPG
jgi:1,4-dihydroxy-2-naphthoyl-CoA hydrolase